MARGKGQEGSREGRRAEDTSIHGVRPLVTSFWLFTPWVPSSPSKTQTQASVCCLCLSMFRQLHPAGCRPGGVTFVESGSLLGREPSWLSSSLLLFSSISHWFSATRKNCGCHGSFTGGFQRALFLFLCFIVLKLEKNMQLCTLTAAWNCLRNNTHSHCMISQVLHILKTGPLCSLGWPDSQRSTCDPECYD